MATDGSELAPERRAMLAEKGRRLMDVIVERLAGFLVELANEPMSERFPY